MQLEGPPLESLTRRLAETPEDFIAEPFIAGTGRIHVAAVVNDLIRLLGGTVDAGQLAIFKGSDPRRDRNHLSIALLLCWILSEDWFRGARLEANVLLGLIREGAAELAAQASAPKFITDPDRREELARFALAGLGIRPAGETVAQAQDRLTSISSAERARVTRASREAELRAKAIREALIKKRAEESADKFTRE